FSPCWLRADAIIRFAHPHLKCGLPRPGLATRRVRDPTQRYVHHDSPRTYTMTTRILSAVTSFFLLISAAAFAQNFEITPHIGYQINGGLDNFQTTLFDRLEVENGTSYGVTLGYLPGEMVGFEFDWNHSHADTIAEPFGGGQGIKLFSLN